MRISDWSSYVCSSDLILFKAETAFKNERDHASARVVGVGPDVRAEGFVAVGLSFCERRISKNGSGQRLKSNSNTELLDHVSRTEERRGGKECVSTGESWWSPYH